jgi:hypothetical protein
MGDIKSLTLGVFTEEEAVEFIKRAPNIEDESQKSEIKNLVETLYRLPLALEQAVAYINKLNQELGKWSDEKLTINNYLELLMLIITLYIHLQILEIINCISNCNFVPYLYFQHMLIITLYIHLQTLEIINCINNCNFVSYLYFQHMLIITLYIHLQILEIINCISNCNFVSYLCFQYVMLIITLYIHIEILIVKNYITPCMFVHMYSFHILCHYISCI